MLPLRPFQHQTLQTLLDPSSPQKHVLCVSPTGSGKSLIYERAAQEPGKRTLLITPLLALARQQYQKLRNLGLPVALGAGGHDRSPPRSESGAWIVSPEMLNFPSRQKMLRNWKPNLLVVDECHCLWEWGEGFRPSFSLVPELLTSYSIHRSLWLTATLPYEARLDLRKKIPHPLTEMGGFELPSTLFLRVQKTNWQDRTQALLTWLSLQSKAGMIFVPTREATLRLARLIAATGKRTIAYHGGMSQEERKTAENLISNQFPEVIVATSAFGMGMDYPHLQYVVLWQAPLSLLSLVQIIGRVGRNPNQLGQALILWDEEDFRMIEWTIQDSQKRRKEVSDLLKFLSGSDCRRNALKWHFDKVHINQPCGRCDVCEQSRHHNKNCHWPKTCYPYSY